MKRSKWVIPTEIFFGLAIVLAAVGCGIIVDQMKHNEVFTAGYVSSQEMDEWFTMAFFHLTIGGALVALGLGMLVLVVLHMLRRTVVMEQETEMLRQKNEAMEKLNQQTQELAHHQRLQTIGTMTSSIAHEFNNLLTPIMGYSMMALEKLPMDDVELYDGILEIYNASLKAKEIISRLSDLSRKNSDMTFHQASVDDLIRKTMDVAAPAKPDNVETKLDLNCWDQRIRVNEIQISQMILNLVLNGFHAMEEKGGVMTIRTSFDDTDISIRVSDTGHGILPEIMDEIFDPFFTTKHTGKGTGLGLAIVAQVVEDHHGHIQVESKVEEGSTFSITLPRTAK